MQAVRVAPPPPRAAGSAADDPRPAPKLPWHLPDAAVLPARTARAESSPGLRVAAGVVSVALHLGAIGVLMIASVQALREVPRVPQPPSVNMIFAAAQPAQAAAPPSPAPPLSRPPPVAQPPATSPPSAPPPPAPTLSATALPPPLPAPLPVPAPKPAAVPPPPPPMLASAEALPPVVPMPKPPAPKPERHRRRRPEPRRPALAERTAPPAPARAARAPEAAVAAAAAPIVPPSLPGGMAERCPPVYPRAALRDRIQGRVVMRVHVAADGRPLSVSVVVSSGSGLLDRAAREAVDACRFVPATEGGRPVPFDYEVPYRFRIEN